MAEETVPDALIEGGGLIQDNFDPDDHYYQAQSSTQSKYSVNLRKDQDHVKFASKAYNQQKSGTCTANAAAAALWYEEKAGGRGSDWGEDGPSRLFIYWLARGGYKNNAHDIPDVKDGGSEMREAMKGIAKVGACHEHKCRFDVSTVNKKPTDDAFNDAGSHKITAYYRLDPDRPDEDDQTLTTTQKDEIGRNLLEKLKKCLTEGFPVAFGFWYYLPGKTMFDQTAKPYVLKDVWTPDEGFPRHTFPQDLEDDMRIKDANGDIIQPGHSVLAIGYDEGRQQVLVQNSWGEGWSGDGTFWMPYAWITDFAASNDFWTIRTTESLSGEPLKWKEVHDKICVACQ